MQSSRAEAIQEIRRELRRLEHHRRISRDAITLAHDVLNPLASIALTLELEYGDEPRESLRSMLQSCEAVRTRLLEFLEHGRSPAPVEDPTLERRIDALCAPLARRPIPGRLFGWRNV